MKNIAKFVSSVRSSKSHPDLLLIYPPTHPLFHITPVLNTGLSLSELYSYIKAIRLDIKAITGLISWLHVYIVVTTGHHCKIVQDSGRWWKMVEDGARWCKMVQDCARLCKMVQGGAKWCKMV